MVFFDLIEVTINPNHPQYELVSSALNILQALYNYSLQYQRPSEKGIKYPLFTKLSNLIHHSQQLHSKIQLHCPSPEISPEQQEGWDPTTNTITIAEISSQIHLISKLINFLHYSVKPWLNDPSELAKILAQANSLSSFTLSLKLAYYYYCHLPQHQTLKELKINLPLVLNETPEEQQKALLNFAWESLTDTPLSIEAFLATTEIPESLIECTTKQKYVAASQQRIYSKDTLSIEIIDVLNKTEAFLAEQREKERAQPATKKMKFCI